MFENLFIILSLISLSLYIFDIAFCSLILLCLIIEIILKYILHANCSLTNYLDNKFYISVKYAFAFQLFTISMLIMITIILNQLNY